MINLLSDVADFSVRPGPEPVLSKRFLRRLMDAGGWVTREEIEEALWGDREDGGPETVIKSVDVLLHRLRPRLRDGFFIEAQYKRGYRLVVDWELFEDTALKAVQAVLVA